MRRRYADEFVHHLRIGVRENPPNDGAQVMAHNRHTLGADGDQELAQIFADFLRCVIEAPQRLVRVVEPLQVEGDDVEVLR